MAGLIERIKSIFDTLLIRDPKELQRRRELRKIHDYLKNLKPSYYKQSSGEVLPGFAVILLDFARILRPICELLGKTLANAEPKVSFLYKQYLIEKRLPEKESERIRMLTYENVKDRILKSPSPETELKIVGNEIQEIIKNLSSPQFNNFDLEYNQLNKLIALCKFDMEKILKLFDMKIRLDSKQKPNFTPVMGEQVINELLDIYFILWNFNPELGVENNLSMLMERLSRVNTEEGKIKLHKLINRLKQLLKKHLSQSTILLLIRAIKQDPFFTPERDKEFHTFIEYYKRTLTDRYIQIRDRILRERRENAIAQDIEALFGKAELLAIKGYNEKQSEILMLENFPGFKFIKPLRIVKSFIVAKFEKNIREDVNKLLVEGYFENKFFQDSLSNVYHTCSQFLEKMSEFEDQINENSKFSITNLNKYLKVYSTGRKVEATITRMIESLDGEVLEFLEEIIGGFYKLASLLREVLNDYRQSTPTYISNLKVIGGVKNREYMGQLLNDYNDIIKLIRIMKNFTIIKPSIEEAKAKQKKVVAAAGEGQAAEKDSL